MTRERGTLGSEDATAAPLLEVTALETCYADGIEVLRGVDLHVVEGEVVAVLGANGAGKTTLLRAVTGLLVGQGGSVTHGSVTFRPAGAGVLDTRKLTRAGMAQVLEGRRLFRDLTVEENLLLGASTEQSPGVCRERLAEAYDRFPILRDKRTTQAGLLSGGQQQIAAIARALMSAPRLLVLDEPSLGLAPRTVGEVRDLLTELNDDGTTILLVEQNARMALSIADRGYVVERGRVTRSGTRDELVGAGVSDSLVAPVTTTPRSEPDVDRELPWLR